MRSCLRGWNVRLASSQIDGRAWLGAGGLASFALASSSSSRVRLAAAVIGIERFKRGGRRRRSWRE